MHRLSNAVCYLIELERSNGYLASCTRRVILFTPLHSIHPGLNKRSKRIFLFAFIYVYSSTSGDGIFRTLNGFI